jgi:hypothetical protein
MTDEADYFANWLWIQQGGGILPNQVEAGKNILNRMRTGDLVRVMYYGKPETALKALQILKERFVDDLEAFEQQQMERQHETSWH